METQAILDRLQQRFGQWVTGSDAGAIDPWVGIAPEGLVEGCRFLRDEPDPKKAQKVQWQPHLEVLYHLSSLVHRHRLVARVTLPRWKDDVPGRLPEVPSVSRLWRTALWHEREVFDLSGVRFLGHPDLRRILCPEDWVGHPLRKDYQMPAEYHGIRGG
jgi:NADH-quinone oxidoreductase subunit C